MAANVNSFLANFTGGGARANRYEVIIGFPNFLNIRDTTVQQKISFTCKAASIPHFHHELDSGTQYTWSRFLSLPMQVRGLPHPLH